MTEDAAPAFEGWAILELMGHRRLAGYVREVTLFGASLIRLDVPAGEAVAPGERLDGAEHNASLLGTSVFPDPCVTQFYSSAALYSLTPTTEAAARSVAAYARPRPALAWELNAPAKFPRYEGRDTEDEPEPVDAELVEEPEAVLTGDGAPREPAGDDIPF